MSKIRQEDPVRALSTVKLFSGCTQRELREVTRLCTPMPVEPGFVLTFQGAVGDQCFVIAHGQATVAIAGRPVGRVGPGDCVGEMALLDGGRRTATVTAETPMTVYALSVSEFRALLAASPSIGRNIATGIARRLRDVEDLLF